MKPIKIPSRYNYIATFLTLKCNLNCSYCLNDNSGVIRKRNEMSADEWIKGLNRLETNLPPVLEGGESTLHKGFYDILEKARHPFDILTNLQFDVDKFVRKVNPEWLNKGQHPSYKSIRASFHAKQMGLENTINKAVKLQDAGFDIGLFALNLPETTEANMRMAEEARQNKIYFFIKDFLGYRNERLFGHFKYPKALDGIKKDTLCRLKELIISPDGEIYRCHRDLYHAENSIGHLLDEDFKIKDEFQPCSNYGLCNPCDVKEKTNRYLQMGNCQMEIKND